MHEQLNINKTQYAGNIKLSPLPKVMHNGKHSPLFLALKPI